MLAGADKLPAFARRRWQFRQRANVRGAAGGPFFPATVAHLL